MNIDNEINKRGFAKEIFLISFSQMLASDIKTIKQKRTEIDIFP